MFFRGVRRVVRVVRVVSVVHTEACESWHHQETHRLIYIPGNVRSRCAPGRLEVAPGGLGARLVDGLVTTHPHSYIGAIATSSDMTCPKPPAAASLGLSGERVALLPRGKRHAEQECQVRKWFQLHVRKSC